MLAFIKQKQRDWLTLGLRGIYVGLPYLPALSLLGILAFTGWGWWHHSVSLSRLRYNWGLLALTGFMLLNCSFSAYPAESWLQLVNYLPFFAGYGVLARSLGEIGLARQVAVDLVLASLPINLIGVIEFSIKVWRLANPQLASQIQIFGWPSSAEANRSVAIFSHPNFYASYMVLILGLGLGLFVGVNRQGFVPKSWVGRLLLLGAGLSFAGIFCSGSRNALAVGVLQVLLAGSLLKLKPWLRWVGWLSLGGLAGLVLSVGLGGRQISLEVFQNDPRFGLWQIAAGLIQERPILGWGLGSFKFLYPSRLIDPGYPSIAHPHNFGLMIAAEAGLPILLVFVGIVGFICYQGLRAYLNRLWFAPEKAILLAYLLALLGSFTYALFDTTLFDARINLLNWTALAVLTGIGQPQAKIQPEL